MRYVVALGGNAIGSRLSPNAARFITGLYKRGNEVVVTHGNGPQVGALSEVEDKSLSILTAQTQAEIGTIIQAGLLKSMRSRILEHNMPIIITRCLVSPNDPEMRTPSKPIGRFLTKSQADSASRHGQHVRLLIGGYRRVVPSPTPLDVLEIGVIKYVLRRSRMVVAGGGGGVPVAMARSGIRYLDAVIDKDYTSSLIARKIGADMLVILTNTDGVYTSFGKSGQRLIRRTTAAGLEPLIRKGEFESGSMLPKVMACIDFVRKTGKKAAIGNISGAGSSMSATTILP